MADITAVEAYRAVLQTDYCEYVAHVHQGAWKKTPPITTLYHTQTGIVFP